MDVSATFHVCFRGVKSAPVREILRTLTYRDLDYVRRETHLYLKDILDRPQRIETNLQMCRDLLTASLYSLLPQEGVF